MQMTRIRKSLSFILCIVLVAAIALFTTGCTGNKDTTGTTEAPETTLSATDKSEAADETESPEAGGKVDALGEGETQFTFSVTDNEGKEWVCLVNTDKKTVGEALLELELIDGDEGPYGLYVKTVKEITLDYDTDGKYWAFYENGTMASKGVDLTEIIPGAEYGFKAE